jgi:hypothetical protein
MAAAPGRTSPKRCCQHMIARTSSQAAQQPTATAAEPCLLCLADGTADDRKSAYPDASVRLSGVLMPSRKLPWLKLTRRTTLRLCGSASAGSPRPPAPPPIGQPQRRNATKATEMASYRPSNCRRRSNPLPLEHTDSSQAATPRWTQRLRERTANRACMPAPALGGKPGGRLRGSTR